MSKRTIKRQIIGANIMNHIEYKTDKIPTPEAIIELYDSSGIIRPTGNSIRIRQMYAHSNLIISAWEKDKLVGVSRALTDFCYVCYLSDLAVKKEYQKQGIGKRLIELNQKKLAKIPH